MAALSRQQQLIAQMLLGGGGLGTVPQMASPVVPMVDAKGRMPANHPIEQQLRDWPIPRGPMPLSGGEQMRRTGKIR